MIAIFIHEYFFFMTFHEIKFISGFKEKVSLMTNDKFDRNKSNAKGE